MHPEDKQDLAVALIGGFLILILVIILLRVK